MTAQQDMFNDLHNLRAGFVRFFKKVYSQIQGEGERIQYTDVKLGSALDKIFTKKVEDALSRYVKRVVHPDSGGKGPKQPEGGNGQ